MSPSRRTRLALLLVSAAVLITGGVETWAWIHPDNNAGICPILSEDSRVHEALGPSYDRDLTCAKLGARLKDAAIGSAQGVHSMKQAQAMRDILSATDDALTASGHSMEPSLQITLAELLANYASDTHEILRQLDADYLLHLTDEQPWQDKDGVHMTVAHESLVRVMRAVSEDPSAYAKIRTAEGRYAAENLVSIPVHAKDFVVSVRACGNALVFGSLDGIAADATKKLSNSEVTAWQQEVTSTVASASLSDVPTYKSDPVNHVTGAWVKQLQETQKDFSTTFNTQAINYIRIWVENQAENFSLPQNLVQKCQADSERSRSETTDFLDNS